MGILHGDALETLRTLPGESVNCCVTSPPYWGLRDYGVSGQIGLEKTPEEYVARLVEVFREVRQVLRDDGTLWLNLGDSYASGKGTYYNPGGGEDSLGKVRKEEGAHPLDRGNVSDLHKSGLKPKDLVGIPWRVAFALQADGWWLRSDIIWHKPNPMPESVRDRPTKAHEHIFLLAKNKTYYYDQDAIKETAVCGWNGSKFDVGKTGEHQLGRAQKVRPSALKGSFKGKTEAMADTGQNAFRAVVDMRNKRDVWTVSTRPFKGAHFAVFPPDLIQPCILAGCPKDGIVLDPFFGAGTTGLVAVQEGRNYIGIELNSEYVEIAKARIAHWRDNHG